MAKPDIFNECIFSDKTSAAAARERAKIHKSGQ